MDRSEPSSEQRREAVSSPFGDSRRGSDERRTGTAAAALSAAAQHHTEITPVPVNPPRKPSLTVAVLAALAVGAVVMGFQPAERVCTATLRASGASAAQRLPQYGAALIAFVSSAPPASSPRRVKPGSWSVDLATDSTLRLRMLAADESAGLARVRALAGGFLEHLRQQDEEARQSPSEHEDFLGRHTALLRKRLDAAADRVELAMAEIHGEDPRGQRNALLEQWRDARVRFVALRTDLSDAVAGAARLEAQPPVSAGLVATDDRQTALEADLVLQQDLKELHVRLTSIKLELLNVWQHSAKHLERLVVAAKALTQCAPGDHDWLEAQAERAAVEQFTSGAAAFASALVGFARSWNGEFLVLRSTEPDPYSADIIDFHHRTRTLLADYLFAAGKQLGSLRSFVQSLAQSPIDTARYHVLHSALTRSFEVTQISHHRFEFSAGELEAAANFRLDSALRIARGLRRRSQARIRGIDANLRQDASERARQAHLAAMTAAQERVVRVRADTDLAIERIVALQDDLNQTTELTEEFLQTLLQAELADARYETVQSHLTEMEEQMHKLASQRSKRPEVQLELVGCTAEINPADFARRARAAGFGAGMTLIVVLLAQYWITRRHHA